MSTPQFLVCLSPLPPDLELPVILRTDSVGRGPSLILRRGRNASEDVVTSHNVHVCVRVCDQGVGPGDSYPRGPGTTQKAQSTHDFSSLPAPPSQHSAPLQIETLKGEERMPAARGKSKSKVSSGSSSFGKVPSCKKPFAFLPWEHPIPQRPNQDIVPGFLPSPPPGVGA